MIHRIALLLGGMAAAAVLAFSLVRGDKAALSAADGGVPLTVATEDGVPLPVATEDPTVAPAREVVETVYIAAPPKPKVIHVTRHAPAATAQETARKARPATGRHQDDEHDRDDHRGDDHKGDDHGHDGHKDDQHEDDD